jgi:hypothetical protein
MTNGQLKRFYTAEEGGPTMMYDLIQKAVIVVLLMLAMRHLGLLIAGLVLEGLSLVTAEPDATDATEGTDSAADPAEAGEAAEVAEVAEVAGLSEVAGEAANAAAEGGGWDFLELFEGFELE